MKYLVQIGKQKEIEFANVLTTQLGGNIVYTSRKDDIQKHIDLYWNDIGIDVKGLKRETRSGPITNDYHWIELRNVNGDKGWLFGEAKLFAFETFESWLLISKSRLITFIKEHVISDNITNTPAVYSYYRRNGRFDVIVKVPTLELINIANKILYK